MSNNPTNITILAGNFTEGPNVFEQNLNIERLDVPVIKHDIGPAISVRPNINVITNETGIVVEGREEIVLLQDILQELQKKTKDAPRQEVIVEAEQQTDDMPQTEELDEVRKSAKAIFGESGDLFTFLGSSPRSRVGNKIITRNETNVKQEIPTVPSISSSSRFVSAESM